MKSIYQISQMKRRSETIKAKQWETINKPKGEPRKMPQQLPPTKIMRTNCQNIENFASLLICYSPSLSTILKNYKATDATQSKVNWNFVCCNYHRELCVWRLFRAVFQKRFDRTEKYTANMSRAQQHTRCNCHGWFRTVAKRFGMVVGNAASISNRHPIFMKLWCISLLNNSYRSIHLERVDWKAILTQFFWKFSIYLAKNQTKTTLSALFTRVRERFRRHTVNDWHFELKHIQNIQSKTL